MNKSHYENVKNHNMTFDELAQHATTKGEMPSGLDLISQAAYAALRNIQITWQYGYLTHEQAKLERKRVQNRYIKQRELQAFDRRLIQQIIDNRNIAVLKEIEILKKLRDGKSVEDEALECIGHLLGDKTFMPSVRAMREQSGCN